MVNEMEIGMRDKNEEYPLFSPCGLNCGLCPRYYTDGRSKCPGCAISGFSCGVLSCCRRKGLEYCFLCEEFPCKRYDGVDAYDSFITHKNQLHDLQKAKEIGIDAYKTELEEKVALLEVLLKSYNDGRRKSLFCTAMNLLDVESVRCVMEQLAKVVGAEDSPKVRAEAAVRLLNSAAEENGISLQLRKK